MTELVKFDNGRTMTVSQAGRSMPETLILGDSHHKLMQSVWPESIQMQVEAAATRYYTVYTWRNLIENGDRIFARMKEDSQEAENVTILVGLGSNDLDSPQSPRSPP